MTPDHEEPFPSKECFAVRIQAGFENSISILGMDIAIVYHLGLKDILRIGTQV
jgi:hypothetical protein